MNTIYIIIGIIGSAITLNICLNIISNSRQRSKMLANEKKLLNTNNHAGGLTLSHGIHINSSGDLKSNQKRTPEYYKRLT